MLTFVLLFPIIIMLIVAMYVIITFNNMVGMRNRVLNQSSQIDVELKRRFDLIPNLVETVKGAARHEKTVLEAVIKARSHYMAAGGDTGAALEADNLLSHALSKLFALVENYPELRVNENFKNLQSELSDIEQKLVYARQFYNDSVLNYNNKLEFFPSNIVASLFSFKKEPFFAVEEKEVDVVKVEF